MSGYIAIQRGLLEHPVFKKEPFTEREAWIWLIEEAAWKPKTVRIGDGLFSLKRGELVHACRYMAKAWRWHHLRVWRFLQRLEKCSMIETLAERDATHITICNYDKYQSPRNADETPSETLVKHSRNKEEPLNHLTKEIDSEATHAEVLKIAKVTSDDPFFFGSKHGVDILLERGYSHATICAGASRAMAGKSRPPPWNYFAKCIESENEQRSQPAKPEIARANPETLTQTAFRMSESGIGFGARPSLEGGGDVVRLLPKGGRE